MNKGTIPKRLCKKISEFRVLGYSMGAALAAMAVPELIVNGHHVEHTFLYGCFRIGNPAFAKWAA